MVYNCIYNNDQIVVNNYMVNNCIYNNDNIVVNNYITLLW